MFSNNIGGVGRRCDVIENFKMIQSSDKLVAVAAVATWDTSRFNNIMISQSTCSSNDNDNSTDKDKDNDNNNESNN